MTEIFTLILFILAGVISIGLLFKKNMWPVICAYWIANFLKYAIEIYLKVREEYGYHS